MTNAELVHLALAHASVLRAQEAIVAAHEECASMLEFAVLFPERKAELYALEDAIRARLAEQLTCPHCNGSGRVRRVDDCGAYYDDCVACRGRGYDLSLLDGARNA